MGSTCKTYMDKILKLQKRALRTISNSHYLSHSAPLFKKYKLLNVHDTYDLELSTFMYKHFSSQLPKVFHNYFVVQSKLHKYHTRNHDKYAIPQTKTNFSHKTVRTAGPIKWNTIDKYTKSVKTVTHFRSKIKDNIILNYI